MAKVLELRDKRGKLWEQAKAFLDNAKRDGDVLSADDVATYEKMEADIVALGREIEMLDRQHVLDMELNKPTAAPITGKPSTGTGDVKTGKASDEYKSAFWKTMRNKISYDVVNTLQIGTDSEGGVLVPDEFEAKLIDGLYDENIIRGIATIINTSSGDKKIPVVASHGTANWTDESGEIKESDDRFDLVTLGSHKLTTMIKVSEELINDAAFNLENYIANEFTRRMAAAEEEAFITGNGIGRPTGILVSGHTDITANSSTAITADELIDLYHCLKSQYRKNAVFITNDTTIKVIRKLKDTTGQYMWQPGLQAAQPDTILNRPMYTSSFMPTVEAGAKTMLFGDFSYYWIADRQGRIFKRLNELYAETGQVGFIATQRVDGKLILPEAIKVLKQPGTAPSE